MWTRTEREIWRQISVHFPDTVYDYENVPHLYCKRKEFEREELDELAKIYTSKD